MANTALLECLAQQVREAGLATSHADTPEQLMAEVLDQVKKLRTDRDNSETETRQIRELLHRAETKLTEAGNLIRDMSVRLIDEGGRVYLESTNDADHLRELAAWFRGRMYRHSVGAVNSHAELRKLLEEAKDACLHWSPELFDRVCATLKSTEGE